MHQLGVTCVGDLRQEHPKSFSFKEPARIHSPTALPSNAGVRFGFCSGLCGPAGWRKVRPDRCRTTGSPTAVRRTFPRNRAGLAGRAGVGVVSQTVLSRRSHCADVEIVVDQDKLSVIEIGQKAAIVGQGGIDRVRATRKTGVRIIVRRVQGRSSWPSCSG